MGIGSDNQLKVYVRLPVKIRDEVHIKDLHPDIQTVIVPRQKSRRWCFIVFQDEQTRDRVVSHLEQLKIKDKNIIVKPFKLRHPKEKTLELAPPQEGTTDFIESLLTRTKN